jgi:hypothetical protein
VQHSLLDSPTVEDLVLGARENAVEEHDLDIADGIYVETLIPMNRIFNVLDHFRAIER